EQWLDRLVRHWAERQLAACVDDLDRVRRLMAAPSSGAVDEVATTAHNIVADPGPSTRTLSA
ncbi:MAG: hypothetical protein HZA68_21710, partial [Rhodovulum sp.]|nr:hypothetical protein [Rhodovulum sp.]